MSTLGVFIITGASGGLGSSLARAAYSAGFPVALIARSKPDLERLAKELKSLMPKGALISIHPLDLTREKHVEAEIAKIKKLHGSIRALINNAAQWMGSTSAQKLKASDIQKSLDINFYTALHATQSTLRAEKPGKSKELAIINVGATSSLDGWMEVLPFCIAKGALRTMTRAFARDQGPQGAHFAHVVIDGVLDNARTRGLNPGYSKDRFMKTELVAKGILEVALQERSCWTLEWDVRPYHENW